MHLRDLRAPVAAADPRLWLGWTRTLDYMRRLDEAERAIEAWLFRCHRPAICCSGGKDSTVLLHLSRHADPSIPVYRADPPNPLPDRTAHVAVLQHAAGGLWSVEPYPWDVASVLDGRVPYPAQLKIRTLRAALQRDGIDGVALGLRAAESVQRRMVVRGRGLVYPVADGLRCLPLGNWSAEMVLGHILRHDLPLNPVYTKLRALPSASLEHLRDGTWWPHGDSREVRATRPWLALHYPEVLADYDRAVRLPSVGLVEL